MVTGMAGAARHAASTYPLDMMTRADERMTVRCDDGHLWTVWSLNDARLETLPWREIEHRGIDSFLVPTRTGWARIVSARQVPAEPVRCIRVDDPTHLYELENGVYSHNTGGGKSVLQRNVVFHVIAHAKEIKMIGIDLKMVELSAYLPYKNAIIAIATNLDDAVEVLRFAQESMMNRYSDMKVAGHNNFLDMENAGSALLVMIDEAGELLDSSSPAKALEDDTPVPSLEDRRTIGALRPGDHVIGEDGEWHRVIETYEPTEQDAYAITVRRDRDAKEETLIAGEEHLWTVWPRGLDGDHVTVTTAQLHSMILGMTPAQRSRVKLRRSRTGGAIRENGSLTTDDHDPRESDAGTADDACTGPVTRYQGEGNAR